MNTYSVRHPETGEVEKHNWTNASELVRHAGWKWVKDEDTILAQVREESVKNSNTNGNVRGYDAAREDSDVATKADDVDGDEAPSLEEMTRDELFAYADLVGLEGVDKRTGSKNLIAAIREHEAKAGEAE